MPPKWDLYSIKHLEKDLELRGDTSVHAIAEALEYSIPSSCLCISEGAKRWESAGSLGAGLKACVLHGEKEIKNSTYLAYHKERLRSDLITAL